MSEEASWTFMDSWSLETVELQTIGSSIGTSLYTGQTPDPAPERDTRVIRQLISPLSNLQNNISKWKHTVRQRQ